MINISNYAKQFKNCERLNYTAYVCKVPVGSCVLSPVFNYQTIRYLRGRVFLSVREVAQIQQSNPNLFSQISGRLIRPNDFVININGIMDIISGNELISSYRLASGYPINESSLLSKSYICEVQDGFATPVDITLNRACKMGIADMKSNLVIPWFKVQWYGNYEEKYLYIDRQKMPEFTPCLPDRNRDYIVIVADNNANTAKIIPVEEFVYCYDMRGKSFGSCKKRVVKAPKPLFEFSKSMHGIKTFAIVIQELINSMYSSSFAIQFGVVSDIATEVMSHDCLAISYKLGIGDTLFLAYKKGSSYYFALAYEDVFKYEFDSDLERYQKHLESDKSVIFREMDYRTYREYLIAFLSLYNSSVISNYYNPPLTVNELVSLKKYSGIEYGNINSYLRGGEVEDKFMAYIQSVFISEIIERSRVLRNQYHFRGMTLDERIVLKEGYVIKHQNFVSTTLSCSVTFDFAACAEKGTQGVILVFKNTVKKHGIFIDSYSAHKGKEFEVLFNVGSNFKLIRRLGYYHELDCKPCEVWLCELIEDKNVSIRKYAYQKDAVEKLVCQLQSSDLMRAFYISGVLDESGTIGVTLVRYNSEDITICIKLKDDLFTVEFTGSIKEKYSFSLQEMGYNHLFQYIYFVLKTQGTNQELASTALSTFSERFMLRLMGIFTNNNFIISQQKINIGTFDDPFGGMGEFSLPLPNAKKGTSKEVRRSELSILNADAKPVKVELKLSIFDKKDIVVEMDAHDGKSLLITRKITKGVEQGLLIAEEVYNTVIQRFSLDPRRRLKHIFSIVAGFHEQYIEFFGQNGNYTCYFDDKAFNISQIGSTIRVTNNGSTVEFNYYDDIYESASKIQAMI